MKQFYDLATNLKIDDDATEGLLTKRQYIPDEFLDDLKDLKHESSNAPLGDFHLAASIPVAVVEEWMAQGFNIYDQNIGLEAIMKRLRQHDMEQLIATNRRLY